MDDSTLERRHALRAHAAIAVEIRDSHGFSMHSTRDVSAGGLFFDRAIPHPVGARVELAFSLPQDGHLIRCHGEVVNVPNAKGFGMGIHFVDLSDDDARRLAAFASEVQTQE